MALVSSNFPHPIPAVVAGAQPKIAVVRNADGSYNADGPDTAERYAICEDMALQLVKYCARKRGENPGWTEHRTQEKVFAAFSTKIASGEWKFSTEERGWVEKRVMELRDRT